MDYETMFEALARKASGEQQYTPAPGEAAMGIAVIAGVVGRLMNESDKYELREENARLRAQLDAQQQAQMAALMQQNQQLMLMLQQQQGGQPGAQAGGGIDLDALLEALLSAATPEQAQQVRRLLSDNPQAARLALPERAGARRKGRRG